MKKSAYLIISELLNRGEDYTSISSISEKLNLSKSTIRSSIEDADFFLTSAGFDSIEKVTGKGIRLNHAEFDDIHGYIIRNNEIQFFDTTNIEERKAIELYSLMYSQKNIVLNELAEKMSVSERTVNNDFNQLRIFLSSYGFNLDYDKRKGYCLTANRFAARNLLNQMLLSIFGPFEKTLLYAFLVKAGSYGNVGIGISRDQFETLRIGLEQILGFISSNDFLANVLLFLTESYFDACREDSFPSMMQDIERKNIKETAAFRLAQLSILQAQGIFKTEFSRDDVYYLTELLSYYPLTWKNSLSVNYPFETEMMTNTIISYVSTKLSYDFYSDEDFVKSLKNHLLGLQSRIQYHKQMLNPLLPSIKEQYSALFDYVRQAFERIERNLGIHVIEDEVAFITLYFASSIDKLRLKDRTIKNIAIVCNSGNAVSRFLQYRISSVFDVNVVDILSKNELKRRLPGINVEMVVSVVDIKDIIPTGIPYCLISGAFDQNDYLKLSAFFRKFNVSSSSENREPEGKRLLEFLSEEKVQFLDSARNFDELIKLGGKPLVDGGDCLPDYIHDMLICAHSFSNVYMVIAPGVALLHAGISKNVIRPGIALTLLSHPVYVQGKSIFCAFALCATDKVSHAKALKELGELLNEAEFIRRLAEIRSYSDLIDLIIIFEKEK
ncbi:PRD domain-containing protein [Erysipelotrichaceae bacterium Oil+RF-744-GAM-WT-6]|uniref:PRD domain-containing protein n=1 Tax=Stecheria intestinalis TaxID=2606630 RepID=A0A7X2TGP2_9FIRM|nr:PRD domain-containing protein [Stecheria intestinalis]MSS59435.1 PRD domain-containing protein [Stecheria intestinalis]